MQNLSKEEQMYSQKRGESEEMKIRKAVKENQIALEKSQKIHFHIAKYEIGGRKEEGRFHKNLLKNECWRFLCFPSLYFLEMQL